MRGTWGIERALLLFGLVNAALFAALLPLWEGFDEAYHYGYVEALCQTRRLPVLGRTTLPYDVVASFPLAPVSPVIRGPIPEGIPYDAWFALPPAQRAARRHELDQLRADPRPTSRGNYEAHQPPLAYLLLAPLDWALQKLPLLDRVLALRLVCGFGAVGLLFFGARALCRALEVPGPFAAAALFLIFATEMFYATTAHVANDWLAVGIGAGFFAGLAKFVRAPDRRAALRMSGWLAAGLLAKAYFLIFAVVAGWVWWRRRRGIGVVLPAAALILVLAGPWYARNLILYGNLGGTPESFAGVGIRQALAAAPRIDWLATAGYLARASLWTGNNWFNSFSHITLNLALALLAAGFVAWLAHRRAIQPAEWAVAGAMLLFVAGVAYEGCAMVAQRGSHVAGPSPWYTQVLLAPVVALACLGLARTKPAGRVLAAAMVALWAWILAATWTLKLFPMYSGGASSPVRLREIWRWHIDSQALSATALAPTPWLYLGMALSLLLAVGLAVRVVRGLSK